MFNLEEIEENRFGFTIGILPPEQIDTLNTLTDAFLASLCEDLDIDENDFTKMA